MFFVLCFLCTCSSALLSSIAFIVSDGAHAVFILIDSRDKMDSVDWNVLEIE